MLKVEYDSLSHLSQQKKTSGRNDEKMVARQTHPVLHDMHGERFLVEYLAPQRRPLSQVQAQTQVWASVSSGIS